MARRTTEDAELSRQAAAALRRGDKGAAGVAVTAMSPDGQRQVLERMRARMEES